jgi:hypothetical protein
MSAPVTPRLSLILPIGSRAALLAASQIVLSLLRQMRIELDLLRGPAAPDAPSQSVPGRPGTILFLAANLPWPTGQDPSRSEFEQELQARIKRVYARHGVSPVVYGLEIL